MSYVCDVCITSFADAVNIQTNFLKTFKTKYFKDNGPKSKKVLEESSDYKWQGLSINILLDYAKKYNYETDEIKDSMLHNHEFMEKGKYLFLDLYNEGGEKCVGTKWSVCFEGSNEVVVKGIYFIEKTDDKVHCT